MTLSLVYAPVGVVRAQETSSPSPPGLPNEVQPRLRPAPGDQPAEKPGPEPGILRRPIDSPARPALPELLDSPETFFRQPDLPPMGYTGPSGVLPMESQESSHFVPIEDRWRIGYPAWDRYDKGHPITDDYPYMPGRWFDPYCQNVFKGDYPILGQHTFLEITGQANLDFEGRQLPTQTSGFESTERPFSGTSSAGPTASSRSTSCRYRSTSFTATPRSSRWIGESS